MFKTSFIRFAAIFATVTTHYIVNGFTVISKNHHVATTPSPSTTSLYMGLFDGKFSAFGSASKKDLDEQWETQQEILRNRRKPKEQRDQYFAKIAKQRADASVKQQEMWSWQTKQYRTGEDPIDEWKKRRAAGTISDLENQYGDPKKIGGIPLPMASFGVGGEFGVGGKYDNGGRFDLRLPYADQGYVDEDADVMGKMASFFSGGNKKKSTPAPTNNNKKTNINSKAKKEEPPQKKNNWPW